MLIVDAHLDLAYNVGRGRDVRLPAARQPVVDNEIATVGLPDLARGNVGLICATIFCPPWRYGRSGYQTADEAWAIAQEQIRCYNTWTAERLLQPVLRRTDLAPLQQATSDTPQSPTKYILLLEGADAVRGPGDVAALHSQGVRIIGLAWRKNRMAGGTGFPGPITPEGRAVVTGMDELGMIHDASHLADEAFWQLMDLTGGPVIASHSNCRAIVPGDRQMSDDMLKAVIARGGVIGMNFYDQFLMPPDQYRTRRCTMDDLLAHVKHLCDLAGSARHVAIGTDLDGGVGREEIPQEIKSAADLPKLADALSAIGLPDADVANVMSGNWLRFFSAHLPA
jgi:membrane dipeptidase